MLLDQMLGQLLLERGRSAHVQKTYWVSVPPRPSGAEFHAATADLSNHRAEVRLMAASMSFGTRAEVCGLPALLDHAAHRADSVIFDCPGDVDVHAYVARMDFYANLPTNVVLSRPAPTIRRRDRRSGSSN
jgi:hypothetical protein